MWTPLVNFEPETKLSGLGGIRSKTYQLMPGYYRQNLQTSEATLMNKFKQNASLMVDNAPKDEFDWMFLMQHYGAPTRLLDWSDSALVALYFCCSSKPDENGAIWLLKPVAMNKAANIHDDSDVGYLPSFQDEVLTGYKFKELNAQRHIRLNPVATIANRNNKRLQAQLGNFTIHHNKREPIEEITPDSCKKLIVPSDNKAILRKELETLGVTKLQLFPELSSVGELLKENMS